MKYFKIKENSLAARVAARWMRSKNVAMVLGKTIHLHGVSKKDFLADDCWLRHELKHVEQFEQQGYFTFLAKYIWQCARCGYHNCSFEKEARAAENDMQLLKKYQLQNKKKKHA